MLYSSRARRNANRFTSIFSERSNLCDVTYDFAPISTFGSPIFKHEHEKANITRIVPDDLPSLNNGIQSKVLLVTSYRGGSI